MTITLLTQLSAAPDAALASLHSMSAHLPHAAGRVVADPSTTNLRDWLKSNVVQVIFLVIGISMLAAAYRGNASKVMMTAGLSLVGVLWIGMAATNNIDHVSGWLMGLVGIA